MVRIILIAVTVLGLAAGYFGIEAKSKIVNGRKELEDLKTGSSASAQKIKKAEEAAQEAEKKAAEIAAAKTALETEVSTAKSDAARIQTSLTAAEGKVKEKEDEITTVRNELATAKEAAEKAATPQVDTAQEEKLRELQTKLDEQVTVAKALEKTKAEAEEKAAALQAEAERRAAGVNKPGLEGKILGVNPSWNFVLLSIGDRQGVAVNSTLLVKRGGDLIAKVRVTSIDRSTSVADIVPGSAARGTFVQPGDTVIFGG